MIRLLFLIVFMMGAIGCQTIPKCGSEMRAAFDVGSGSTKLKVVELNMCAQTVTRVVLEDQVKVDYRDALEKNANGEFPESIQSEGLAALTKLKGEAEAQGAHKFTGVATAAFRQAKNAEDFTKQIHDKLGVTLRIISQSNEALLGFQAARAQVKAVTQDVVVWDIGGGSMQMTSVDDTVKPVVYFGNLASVSFKNQVIAKVQKKNIAKVDSPNPLKKNQVAPAMLIAEKEALATVPASIQKKLAEPESIVVGIGGVLTKSVPRQMVAGSKLTYDTIKAALDIRAGMTDKEINGEYAATEVTNLALVAGFMKALKIKSYQPAEVSLVDALWFDTDVWQ